MAEVQSQPFHLDFLTGGGELGRLMRGHDWSLSPLGAPETWPQSLRSVVGLMLGSSYPMFVAWGADLAFLYNDGYAPIFGAKHPHALGLPFRQVWSEIWADIEPLVAKALAGEATFHENLHLVMERNGYPEDTWYSFSYSPVRDESGQVAGMFCACTETTRQVLAERRLATENERQRRLFEQAPGFITILNGPEHVFEFVNRAYSRLFGDRDFVGRTARNAFPELEGQGFFELLDQVYATGERFVAHHVPIRLRRSPGEQAEERFLDFIYEPVKADDGRVTGIFCEGHDVTEAHRAQASLRASEEFNRRILASSADCIKVLTLDGSIESMSESGARAIGCDAANPPPLNSSWPELFQPDERDSGRAAIARAARGETARFEASTVTPAGKTLVWDSVLTPIAGADGQPEKILGLSRDITAQRAAQAALHEESRILDTLNRTGTSLAGELDLERVVQRVTDAGVELTGAKFGAFFYNIVKEGGERLMLYALSGAERSAFDSLGMPRATDVFGPTFRNEGVLRSDDILADPRYGRHGPHHGSRRVTCRCAATSRCRWPRARAR